MNKIVVCVVMTLLHFIGNGVVTAVTVEQDLSMTLGEKKTLDRFRDIMTPLLHQDYMKTDIYLIRWLRAKNFNLREAEKMLKENLRWRQEQKMDRIQFEDFSDMVDELPTTVDTYDKEGRPIGVIDFFNWDIRGTVLAGRGARALRYLDMQMNNLTLQVLERQQRGMNVTQWLVLGGADGVNMINHGCPICIPYWIRFLNSLENHFPGWIDDLIVIDASLATNTILEIVKPFLSRNTRQALKMFGTNKNQWQTYLDKRISRSERRAAYGGTKPAVGRDQ